MEVCHTLDILESPAARQLRHFVRERESAWQDGTPDFDQFERELHEHVTALERELIATELARYDVSAEQIEVAGVVYHPVLTASETYLSAAGPVQVERHLYRPAGRNAKSICPLELRVGIVSGYWTARAARLGAFAMAHLTPVKPKRCLTKWARCGPRAAVWTACRANCRPIGNSTGWSGKPPCASRKRCLPKRSPSPCRWMG